MTSSRPFILALVAKCLRVGELDLDVICPYLSLFPFKTVFEYWRPSGSVYAVKDPAYHKDNGNGFRRRGTAVARQGTV